MLTIKQNFIETVSGGNPDRFVKQYEYQAWLDDPLFPIYFGVPIRGTEWTNGWGVHQKFPEGVPGAFPLCEGDDKVCPDVTNWRETVHAPNMDLGPEAWEECIKGFEAIDKNEYFPTAKVFCGMFEKCHYLMGMEDTMINFYEEPEAMHELIDYMADWECTIADEHFKYVKPEILFHHDDWGSQRSLFISKEMFDEFFLPAYKKIYGHWKDLGIKYIVHHSDSYAADLVPEMIEMGIDVWQGGMSTNNKKELVEKYKGQIGFMTGIDSAWVDNPDNSRENTRDWVRKVLDEYETPNGFIPCITQGGPMSTYPGVYADACEEIAAYNQERFGCSSNFCREMKLG